MTHLKESLKSREAAHEKEVLAYETRIEALTAELGGATSALDTEEKVSLLEIYVSNLMAQSHFY